MFIPLTPTVAVAGQIAPDDVAAAAARGITRIINNRPDGEQPGQPSGAAIAAAAAAAGLGYTAIPVDHSGFSREQVDAMIAALASGEPTLAFCRSGTRSTLLWALARAAQGDDPAALAETAAAAGYDLRPIMPLLHQLQPR
ncbi:TIGR01244 family sulfur transferase [Sandaracinobacteroides saxicola]|uniref:TIGR01244 family phosphatase n=1 Tax=Sandaracinobacteroides saxicola TaxID=2759707 RepID=A0A7G5IHU0_9SPHN|nr:TIGR01244 family sulfur transferase [Sandaracinobacteroides saxicola]QMW22932.1 TIGR01244 family phosphatase [Sandaracinobacteroides saxicola]